MRAVNLAMTCLFLTQSATAITPCYAASGNDDPAATLIKRGEAAAAAGDWRAAAGDFSQAAQAPEWKKTALYDLGVAYYHLGDFAQALSVEHQVTDLDDRYVAAYVQIATILTKMGNYEGAQGALSKALEIEPGSRLAQTNQERLKELIAANPGRKDVSVQAGTEAAAPAPATESAGSKSDEPVKAVKIFDGSENPAPAAPATESAGSKGDEPVKAIKIFDGSETPAPAPEGANVGDKSAAAEVGQTATPETKAGSHSDLEFKVQTSASNAGGQQPAKKDGQAGQPSALSSADEVLKSTALPGVAGAMDQRGQPGAPVQQTEAAARARSKQKVADLIAEASVYFNSGAVDNAKQALKSAVDTDPDCALAHANLGVVLGTQGDCEGQIAEERRATELEPANTEAHLNLAWALAMVKRWPEAEKEYARTLELNKNLPEAQSGRAFVLYKMGKAHEAVNLLTEASKQNAKAAWPCIALSTVYLEQKKTAEAKAQLNEALAREPENVDALKRQAQLSLDAKHWSEAIDQYRAALKKAPYDLDACMGLSVALEKNGDNEGALKSLQAAVQIAPSNAAAHASLSMVMERLGRAQEAEKEARVALKLDPKQQIAQSVLHRVSR